MDYSYYMDWFIGISLVIVGLIVGSFLNVCIYRIPKGLSLNANHGRSMCPKCGKTLKWYDMVPIFSYLYLGGKCRKCKEPISFRYPLVEFLNAFSWGLCLWRFGITPKAFIYCALCTVLIVMSMIDWDTKEILYRFQVMILILAVISYFFPGFPEIKSRLLAVAVVCIPMAIITLVANGFGGGDIQLMATTGLLIGLKGNIIAILIGVIIGGGYSFVLMRLRAKKKGESKTEKKEESNMIAFGPFLSIGIAVSVLAGDIVSKWYLGLF